jgi:hypothetical protein
VDEGLEATGSGVGAADFGNFVTGFPTRFYPNKSNINNATLVSVKKGQVTKDIAITYPFTNDPEAIFTIYHDSPTDLEVFVAIGPSATDLDFSEEVAISDDDGDNIISVEFDLKDAKDLLPPTSSNKVFLLTRDGENNSKNGAVLNFSVYDSKKLYVAKITDSNSFIGYTNKGIYNSNSIDGSRNFSTTKFNQSLSFDAICVTEKGAVDKDGIFTPSGSTATDTEDTTNTDTTKSNGGGCLLNPRAGNYDLLTIVFLLIVLCIMRKKKRRGFSL